MTQQAELLLPCPFCGAAAHFEIDDDRWEWVECESCGMQGNRGVSLMADCKPMLREAWNRRPQPAAPDGYALVPTEPTPDMLSALVYRRWPADMEAGHRLQTEQRRRGVDYEDRIPQKTEFEVAVGQYQRMLAAAPQPTVTG